MEYIVTAILVGFVSVVGFIVTGAIVGQIAVTGMLVTAHAFKVLVCGCKKGK